MKDIEKKVEADLVENYAKYYRLEFSYVQNETDALDIVQEGAYQAMKSSKQIKEAAYISTWIYRIMINEALKLIRKNQRVVPISEDYEAGEKDRYENLDLKEAINRLEYTDQTIIRLRFFEDMSIKQISDIVETNENSVKSRLYRALKKLKINLEDIGYEGDAGFEGGI